MCGIVGYAGSQQAAPILLAGLERLEYRGYDSAGIVVEQGGKLAVCKESGRISRLAEACEGGRAIGGVTGVGHTRWATHGAPTHANAHPHASGDGRFAVVHNGIIENYLDLKEELASLGYRFESETDTEVVAHLLERYYEGDFRQATMRAVSRLRGSYALGVICSDAPGRIIVAREASPLIIGLGAGENHFASDVTALAAHTRNCIYLEDGDFAEITPGSVKVFDLSGGQLQRPVVRINWDVSAAEKGGYDHFMLKEIMEQPAAVKAAIAPRIRPDGVTFEGLRLDREAIRGFRRIVVTGCGSAYYAGCAAKTALENLSGIPVSVELASELRYANPLINKSTLLIAISQSGETADTIAALREGQRRGAWTIAVVNVVGSTAATIADDVIYTWAGPEIAVATTKGYTTQLAVLYLLAAYLGSELGRLGGEDLSSFLEELSSLPGKVQQALDLNPRIPQMARRYISSGSVFFMGRGVDHAVALEGALKMKEISYVHAEAYAAGELKHGTIALVDEGQPVVAVCCDRRLVQKTSSNIVEVKARGARVLAIGERGDASMASVADEVLYVPETPSGLSALVAVIPLQLLAYYAARERGCDIDKPKNLAKSVTVE